MSKTAETQQSPKINTKTVRKIIDQLKQQSAESQNLFSTFKLLQAEVVKFKPDQDSQKCLLLTLPFPFVASQKQTIPKIINQVQKQTKLNTFVVSKKTMISKRSGYKQKIPVSRTLNAVHDRTLEELLFPANIVGKRVRFNLKG